MPDTLADALEQRARTDADVERLARHAGGQRADDESKAAQFVPDPVAEYHLRRDADKPPADLAEAIYRDRRAAAIRAGTFTPEEAQ